MGPDSRVLVRKSRKQSQQYYRVYKVIYDRCFLLFLQIFFWMVWSTCSIGFLYALWSDVSLSVTGEYSCPATSKRDSSSNARVYTVWVGNISIFVTFNNTFIWWLLLYNHFISEVDNSLSSWFALMNSFLELMKFFYLSIEAQHIRW